MGYGRGIKKINGVTVKRSAPVIVCVGKGKTWKFKNVKEASKIMGLKTSQIYKEMKHNGENASNLKWYTEKNYKKLLEKEKARKRRK